MSSNLSAKTITEAIDRLKASTLLATTSVFPLFLITLKCRDLWSVKRFWPGFFSHLQMSICAKPPCSFLVMQSSNNHVAKQTMHKKQHWDADTKEIFTSHYVFEIQLLKFRRAYYVNMWRLRRQIFKWGLTCEVWANVIKKQQKKSQVFIIFALCGARTHDRALAAFSP